MDIDLSLVGMEKGQQYETIITTLDKEGNLNTAPIGVICKNKKEVLCRIFEGSNTLANIRNQRNFIINITLDPILFTLATIGNIPSEYFNIDLDNNLNSGFKTKSFKTDNSKIKSFKADNSKINTKIPTLKNVDAYLICEVLDIKEAVKKSDPIRKSRAGLISSKVVEIVLNKDYVNAPNRGFYSLIESLVNFTRINFVEEDKQKYFLDRFVESKRIINKVGSKKDKEAINLLKKALENRGYNI